MGRFWPFFTPGFPIESNVVNTSRRIDAAYIIMNIEAYHKGIMLIMYRYVQP